MNLSNALLDGQMELPCNLYRLNPSRPPRYFQPEAAWRIIPRVRRQTSNVSDRLRNPGRPCESNCERIVSEMNSFWVVFVGGVGVICSLIGWGWLVGRALHLRQEGVAAGQSAGLGLAFSTVVGGLFNLAHIISKALLLVYLLIGFSLAVVIVLRHGASIRAHAVKALAYLMRHKAVGLLIITVCLLTLMKYMAAISPGWFNQEDDYAGYFVFPFKMIQTGSLGQDPFSERRLVSSLGGKSFLDTFSLVLGDARNLQFMDLGIAFVIVLLLIAEIAAEKQLDLLWTALLLLAAAAYHAPVANITALYTGVVLFLLLFKFLGSTATPPKASRPAVLALLLASMMSLKNSFVPAAIAFWLCYFTLHLWFSRQRKKVLGEAALCAFLIIVLLSPWMAASYRSSGTLFYPLLGLGFHGSRYGTLLRPTDQAGIRNSLAFFHGLEDVLFAMFGTQAALLIIGRHWQTRKGLINVMILVVATLGILAVGIATAGYQAFRYSFPILFSVVLYFSTEQLTHLKFPIGPVSTFYGGVGAVVLLGLLLGGGLNGFFNEDWFHEVVASITMEGIVSKAEVSAYHLMQTSVPPGQRILARLDKNFLLDFRRNPVYIMDTPGGASPPPGMPVFKGPEPLADYLVGNGIRYVAYSYGDDAAYGHALFGDRLAPGVNAWIRSRAQNTFDFQSNIEMLG